MTYINKNILLVASDFVYPPNHGDRVDIWNRILCLNKMGFKIDLVCTIKDEIPNEYLNIVNKYVDKVILVNRKNKLIDMLRKKPLQLRSREGLKGVQFNKFYDYVILQGSYVLPIIQNKKLKYKNIILRMNNDEAVYFKELCKSEKKYWRKLYYYIEAYKFKILDTILINKIPNIFFVSHDEMVKYKNKYSNINAYFMPTAVDMTMKKQLLNNKNVIFVGSLFMANNKEAINFYIEKIHLLLNDIKGYTFIIAGNSKGEGIEWIKDLAFNYSNINIIDSPEKLDDIYANASVFVNPMLHGAGVKLKTVNAIVNGLPVVSTTIGNQGTGLENGKHIYVADEPEKFARYIRMLLNSQEKRQQLVKNSQEYINLYYNQEKILSKYLDEIEGSKNGNFK